jgi:hypothetical protein
MDDKYVIIKNKIYYELHCEIINYYGYYYNVFNKIMYKGIDYYSRNLLINCLEKILNRITYNKYRVWAHAKSTLIIESAYKHFNIAIKNITLFRHIDTINLIYNSIKYQICSDYIMLDMMYDIMKKTR